MSVPLFPFHEFDDSSFENLCANLLRSQFPLASVELNGRKGQKQHGVDIVNVSPSRVYAIQCKCYESFKAADFNEEIAEFWKHIDRWKKLRVSHYVLCLAHEIDDTHLIKAWLSARAKARDHQIELLLWSARTLQEMLSSQPRLVRSYIHDPNWVSLLLGGGAEKDSDAIAALEHTLTATETNVVRWLRASPFNPLLEFCARPSVRKGPTQDAFHQIVDFAGKESATDLPAIERQLQLSIAFTESRLVMSTWQTRRLLGKIVATIVKRLLASGQNERLIHELSERCGGSIDKTILLATSFTANARSPVAFGSTIATKLLSFPHPQVRWLIARRWPMLRQVFLSGGLPIDKNAVLDEKDDWLRRRWQLAFLQDLINSRASEIEVSSLLKDICKREQGTEVGLRFIIALSQWVELETDYRLPKSNDWTAAKTIKVDSMSEAIDAFEIGGNGMSARMVAEIMGLECLKLDNQAAESVQRTSGEGRYGIIETWVNRAIKVASDDSKGELFKELAVSSDEGVRLAVAKCVGMWIVKLDELGLTSEIFKRLLQDENGWVFREALNTLLNHQYAFENNGTDKLIEAASETFLRLRQAGWPESEFGVGGRLLVSGLNKMQADVKLNN